jgi:hypothetical protein
MTNWYKIFYWLTVADNFKNFFVTMIVLFMITSVISTICYLVNGLSDDSDSKRYQTNSRKWMWWSYPFCIMFWFLYLFTPSKGDTLLIIAGGAVGNFVTSDSSSKAIPSDITNFSHMKLKAEMINVDDDIKRQLDVQSPKEKFMDKVKDLSKEQLIEYLQKDTTLIK